MTSVANRAVADAPGAKLWEASLKATDSKLNDQAKSATQRGMRFFISIRAAARCDIYRHRSC